MLRSSTTCPWHERFRHAGLSKGAVSDLSCRRLLIFLFSPAPPDSMLSVLASLFFFLSWSCSAGRGNIEFGGAGGMACVVSESRRGFLYCRPVGKRGHRRNSKSSSTIQAMSLLIAATSRLWPGNFRHPALDRRGFYVGAHLFCAENFVRQL